MEIKEERKALSKKRIKGLIIFLIAIFSFVLIIDLIYFFRGIFK